MKVVIGSKVVRRSNYLRGLHRRFGYIRHIFPGGARVLVFWTYNRRHSTIALKRLEVLTGLPDQDGPRSPSRPPSEDSGY